MADRNLQLGFAEQHGAAAFNRAGRERKARKVLAILEAILGVPSALQLLDIGCSTGFMTRCYAEWFGHVTAVDVDTPAVTYAKQHNASPNLDYLVMDSQQLAFPDAVFHAITCTHIYEHVPDAGKLMAQIYRVLKPGGVCFFSAGNRISLIEPHYRLPLLSVMPKWCAHGYLRLLGRGKYYYETHLTYWGLRRLVNRFELLD
jgi:2-polyprenyl-3-methyl-5-hydroxy-6-metoxy-1,4-benzoquinol methylase